jgi:murein DD-endopeptidase MepM/ murein hydrolase activator NlpD
VDISCLAKRFRVVVGAFAGIAAIFVAAPVQANSASSADIAAPLRTAQAEKPTSGDEQYRKLFSSWQSLEKPAVPALAAVGDAAQAQTPSQASGRRNLVSTRVTGALPGGSMPFGAGQFGPAIGALKPAIPSRAPLSGLRFTSEFGMRYHPILGRMQAHEGVDLAAPIGTPVYATADGLVEKAEWFGGYGLCVQLAHGGNLETRYGHMSRLNVAAGQTVHKGDIIGFVGTTGRSTGPHLHYEVRVAGTAVNPLPYMQGDDTGRAAPTALAATVEK